MPYTKSRQKELAQHLYFTTCHTQKDIADAVGVTPKSMSVWVRSENWADKKKAQYYSPEQLLHQLYDQLRDINSAIAERDEGSKHGTKEELEASAKIVALITSIAKTNPDKWRNINQEIDIASTPPEPKKEGLTTTFKYAGKEIGKIKMGDIPMGGRQPNGTFIADDKTMHKYYSRVAMLLAVADMPGDNTEPDRRPCD